MDDPLSEPQAAPQVGGGRRRPGGTGKTPPFPGRLWGSHRAWGTAHTGNAGREGVLPSPPHTRHQPGPSRLQDTVQAPKQTHQQRPGTCGPRCWPRNVPCVVLGHRPDLCRGKHPPSGPRLAPPPSLVQAVPAPGHTCPALPSPHRCPHSSRVRPRTAGLCGPRPVTGAAGVAKA